MIKRACWEAGNLRLGIYSLLNFQLKYITNHGRVMDLENYHFQAISSDLWHLQTYVLNDVPLYYFNCFLPFLIDSFLDHRGAPNKEVSFTQQITMRS